MQIQHVLTLALVVNTSMWLEQGHDLTPKHIEGCILWPSIQDANILDKVKMLRSKSQLDHSDGNVLALAFVTKQDITGEVLEHGKSSGF